MWEFFGYFMSEAASWKNRPQSQAFDEVEKELQKEDSLLHLFKQQWTGMAGMAFMFVITIFLGIYIRPYYDVGELHAFGKSGATEVSNVVIELLAIFAFTAIILYLAKKNKAWLIKYGMFVVLAIALLYTTVPLMHMFVLDFEVDPFVEEENYDSNAEVLGIVNDELLIVSTPFLSESNVYNNSIQAFNINDLSQPIWNITTPHLYGERNPNLVMSQHGNQLTITSGQFIWVVDAYEGVLLEQFLCFEYDQNGQAIPIPEQRTGCSLAVRTDDSVYVVNNANELFLWKTDPDFPNLMFGPQAKWLIPQQISLDQSNGDLLHAEVIDEDFLLIAVPGGIAFVELEEFNDIPQTSQPIDTIDNASIVFQLNPQGSFTSFDIGASPFDELSFHDENHSKQSMFALIGDSNGDVVGLDIDLEAENENAIRGKGTVSIEDRMALYQFADTIQSVELTDLNEDGFSDVLIVSEQGAHWIYHTSLIERAVFEIDIDVDHAFFVNQNNATQLVLIDSTYGELIEHTTLIRSGEITGDMFPLYGVQFLFWPTIIGFILAALLMVLLIVHREWYVVNFTGVILGAGVCVMLGVTFVPTLAMIFMVLAAIYDAWAVYKSKHMLDLADTMLDLKLPIMLVAPQEKGYSFKDEGRPVQFSTPSAGEPLPRPKTAIKKEAMFMGLGDIIFPGMLVLSALQWLLEAGVTFNDAFLVAMSTLVGGLVGYVVLMSYVARGRAQAGLPLLNGGAILGYIIGGMLIIGEEILKFGITW